MSHGGGFVLINGVMVVVILAVDVRGHWAVQLGRSSPEGRYAVSSPDVVLATARSTHHCTWIPVIRTAAAICRMAVVRNVMIVALTRLNADTESKASG